MTQVVVKRFFGKKRGSRNMRSDKLGGASLGVFFAGFFLAGCIWLGMIIGGLTLPDLHANLNYQETTCTVLDTGRDEQIVDGQSEYRPKIEIEYEVAGTRYRRWAFDVAGIYQTDPALADEIRARFETGKTYPCWYDKDDPSVVVLERGHRWFAWLALVMPASFIAIGGAGLAYSLVTWNKSAERRAAFARRAAEFDPFDQQGDAQSFPNVPSDAHITNSPGTRMSFRLPLAVPSLHLAGLIAACIFWNGLTLVFVSMAIQKHWAGAADWGFTLTLLPLLAVGGVLIALAIRQVRGKAAIGQTIIEIDDHPLVPGGKYSLFLAQSGQLRFDDYRLLLVCEEEVKYLQGTNLRTAAHRTYEHEIARHEPLSITHDNRLEDQLEFEIPPSAMHSFQSGHHRIVWKLVVSAHAAGCPDLTRQYSIIVSPAFPARRTPLHALRTQTA
ncbi:MAG: DUF3592 domain-containing protein [Planctomycetes bacterium]|nr:DUF3592 domain-containing protein [Planctomycetota bacterium]